MASIPSDRKVCPQCKEDKPTTVFGNDKSRQDGRYPYCKSCRTVATRPRSERIRMRALGFKWCPACKQWLELSAFGSNRSQADGLHSACRVCALAQVTAYQLANKAKRRAFEQKRWATKKAHRKANYQRWYGENREQIIARSVERSRTPEGRAKQARANHVRRVRAESAGPATLTAQEWQEIISQQHNRCLGCRKEFGAMLKPTRDHVIPVSCGGPLTRDNTVALCKPCNSRKRDRIIDLRPLTQAAFAL
jgi:5-methylcytosine-specific restriction endonuclease McrA